VTCQSPRRGGTVRWSNRWFFSGSNLTSGQYSALKTLLEAEYTLILPTTSSIVEYTQYDSGSDVPVASNAVSVAGTLATTGRQFTPSDCAACLRFATAARTSKNHPIYLFKYFHAPMIDTGSDGESITSTQKTRIDSFGSDCVAGFNDGTSVRHITGPHGASATGYFTHPYITHRDFPT